MNGSLDRIIDVLSWSIAIAIPFITAILVMYAYDMYMRSKNKVEKEPERIIVKMNNENDDASKTSEEIMLDALESELDLVEDHAREIERINATNIDFNELTLKELKQRQDVREIKGFSRLPKAEIVKRLQEKYN